MKKQLLPFMALMAVNLVGYSQVSGKQELTNKAIVVESQELVFSSQEEKTNQIEKTQKLIDYRLSHGKSKDEMSAYYIGLKKIQDALIIPKK